MTAPLRNTPPRFSPGWWESMTTFNPVTGCLTWNGFADKNGYCRTWANGRSGVLVHRIAFECFYGPFDPALKVCHACDNPRCVHPHHLFLGTQKDNLRDMFSKGRGRPRGWASGELADRVVSLMATHPEMSQRELAVAANTSSESVSKVLKARGLRTRRARCKTTLASPVDAIRESSCECQNSLQRTSYVNQIDPEGSLPPWCRVLGVPPVKPTLAVVVYNRPLEWTSNRQPASVASAWCADAASPAGVSLRFADATSKDATEPRSGATQIREL